MSGCCCWCMTPCSSIGRSCRPSSWEPCRYDCGPVPRCGVWQQQHGPDTCLHGLFAAHMIFKVIGLTSDQPCLSSAATTICLLVGSTCSNHPIPLHFY
jgi:hypothetical protein